MGRGWGECHVLLDLGGVIMAVTVEIAPMAEETRTTIAHVHGGIAVTVGTDNAVAIGACVAEEAAILVDRADRVTGVAVDTQGCGGDGQGVIMAMGAGEEIRSVTTGTVNTGSHGHHQGAVGREL